MKTHTGYAVQTSILLLALALASVVAYPQNKALSFDAYAPPMVFGKWKTILSHAGSQRVTIEVEPVGNTIVIGEVRYWQREDKQITCQFKDSITIQTAKVVAVIEVRFKGNPTGTAVQGTIN